MAWNEETTPNGVGWRERNADSLGEGELCCGIDGSVDGSTARCETAVAIGRPRAGGRG